MRARIRQASRPVERLVGAGERALGRDHLAAEVQQELPRHLGASTELVQVDAHINDAAFAEAALRVFDAWVQDGTIVRGVLA